VSQSNTGQAQPAETLTQETRTFIRQVQTRTRRKNAPEDKIRIVLEGFRLSVPYPSIRPIMPSMAAKCRQFFLADIHPEFGSSLASLHDVCHSKEPDWIDDEGKLLTTDSGPALGFGKYRGRLLKDITKLDGEYLTWVIYEGDFSDQVKQGGEGGGESLETIT
jgi:hypothetical protein